MTNSKTLTITTGQTIILDRIDKFLNMVSEAENRVNDFIATHQFQSTSPIRFTKTAHFYNRRLQDVTPESQDFDRLHAQVQVRVDYDHADIVRSMLPQFTMPRMEPPYALFEANFIMTKDEYAAIRDLWLNQIEARFNSAFSLSLLEDADELNEDAKSKSVMEIWNRHNIEDLIEDDNRHLEEKRLAKQYWEVNVPKFYSNRIALAKQHTHYWRPRRKK